MLLKETIIRKNINKLCVNEVTMFAMLSVVVPVRDSIHWALKGSFASVHRAQHHNHKSPERIHTQQPSVCCYQSSSMHLNKILPVRTTSQDALYIARILESYVRTLLKTWLSASVLLVLCCRVKAPKQQYPPTIQQPAKRLSPERQWLLVPKRDMELGTGSYLATTQGRALAQTVSRRPLTAKNQVQIQASPCEICGGESGIGTGFCRSVRGLLMSVSFRQCYILTPEMETADSSERKLTCLPNHMASQHVRPKVKIPHIKNLLLNKRIILVNKLAIRCKFPSRFVPVR